MPTHAIIDNRREKLIDHIHAILPQSDVARFAVGYLFVSGLESLGNDLDSVKELRLLIGNTSNRETIELLAEGHRRIELVKDRLEEARYSSRSVQKKKVEETAENLKESIELMDQTDQAQELTLSLLRMIEQQRLKVRIYTKGRMHAKAYIFTYAQPNPGNAGIAIVGSSNLSLAGIQDNTELNVLVPDNGNPMQPDSGNHAALVQWFEELWKESQDFEAHLMQELKSSWAASLATPYEIYMKTLYTLVKERLEGDGDSKEILWDDEITRQLADFQKAAVRQAILMIRDNGGCFVADVVGLGKSYIGAGIVKHFERTEHARPLIICPKPLEDMWERYNEIYHLNARVLPMSQLMSDPNYGVNLLEDVKYRDRNFVLIDESHNFRHHTSQRYEELQRFLGAGGGRKVCLLTATPRNSRATDIYNQIKLFHQDDITNLPIDPPNLKQYFKLIEKKERRLQDLLSNILIRRTRRHILRWYGYAGDSGKPLREFSDDKAKEYLGGEKRAYVMVAARHQYFPKRELESLRYSIDDTYSGLYQVLRGYLGRPAGEGTVPKPGIHLTYARYGLWRYVKDSKKKVEPYTELHRAGVNLRGLMRTSLFKRFESSVYAFQESLRRMIRTHEMFLTSLKNGIIPAGEDAESLLGKTGELEEEELLDRLKEQCDTYDIRDFKAEQLIEHVTADVALLKKMLRLVEPIAPDKDAKLQVFLKRLERAPIKKNKCLIFTQYADTARYIYANLNGNKADTEIIFGTDKSKARTAWRFAPKANSDYFDDPPKDEIRILVATDVLAEGLNLQDCNVVINYDLHWNPVRLIQRFGRIDRIGTEYDAIYGLNFLPETALERELNIKAILQERIQEIHQTIGEDAAILDKAEQLNIEAMYAIYAEAKAPDGEDEDGFLDLNQAEEMLRSMKRDEPKEFERILNLRDGIRSARENQSGMTYLLCQAGRYNQAMLVSQDELIISRDLPRALNAIKASLNDPSGSLPEKYNNRIMKAKEAFAEEVKHHETLRRHSMNLDTSQRYVLKELRVLFEQSEDEEKKEQIPEIEKAFRLTPTPAVRKELNHLRRNGVTGDALLEALIDIYLQHRLRDRSREDLLDKRQDEIPRIICSEAL